ncbi:putative slx8 protein [Erysiphe neolycopersici]|uniref:Putative slx8 protein n=1 Tax=Erysiphe neolycopersici TaxID=212602 RepID=A0A420HTB7_9PEZI|nr:putative slx8 protein [Erysiphe neolycopersici]
MASFAENNSDESSRSQVHESLSISQPVSSNNKKSINHSQLPSPTNNSPRTHQNTPSITSSINPELPSLTTYPDESLFVTPSPLNRELQIPPPPSSDYGDLIEYDELLENSTLLDQAHINNSLPIVLDLTESPSIVVSKESGKRQATSPTSERPAKNARVGSSRDTSNIQSNLSAEEIDVVDLRDVETMTQWEEKKAKDTAEALKAHNHREANKPFKLSEFQCIICMDSPTDLTITHCGHLFCSECLHQALHTGDKKCCPVCRTIVYLPRPGARQLKNGIFALEIKLMTKSKKDKRVRGRI